MQGATKLAKDDQRRRRRRGREEDEIGAIAEAVEELKRDHKRQKKSKGGGQEAITEEVVVKGTGKAIARVLEIGLWFQQREEEYQVRLKTGSVSSIDDVSYEKGATPAAGGAEEHRETVEEEQRSSIVADGGKEVDKLPAETIEETRVRKVSVLEVYVSTK